MKDICVILAHCNTEEKIKYLKQCIEELNKQNREILLVSNHPVDFEIQKNVNFYLYKKENEIVYQKDYGLYNIDIYYWQTYGDFYFRSTANMNHCYAVYCLIKYAANFCKINNYDLMHIINYDCIVDDRNILNDHNELLNEYDFVVYDFEGTSFCTNFFSAKTLELWDIFYNNAKSIKEFYYNEWNTPILETVFANYVKKYNKKYIKFSENYLKNRLKNFNLVSVEEIKAFNKISDFFDLGIFNHQGFDKFYLVIKNCKKFVSAIFINGVEKIFLQKDLFYFAPLSCKMDVIDIEIATTDLKKYKFNYKEKSIRTFKLEKENIDLANFFSLNIINQSSSLGDFLAWTPIVSEYAKQKNIEVNYYTPYKNLLQDSYLNINFYDYNQKENIHSQNLINLGCFDDIPWQKMNLQEIASNILGVEHKEARPQISEKFKKQNNFSKKYVCIATQSTAQCKYWNNPNGWQQVVDYLKLLDYEVLCIDRHENFGISSHMNTIPKNCINKTGDLPLEDRINDLMHCEFFIGLGSGLSWLAWACNKPVVMISGFSDPKSEFYTPYRVHNKNVCNSCWNDPNHKFDPANWLWCPRNKNFECSKEISFETVKEKINQCIKDLNISA